MGCIKAKVYGLTWRSIVLKTYLVTGSYNIISSPITTVTQDITGL